MLATLRKTMVPVALAAAILLIPLAPAAAAPPQDAETDWTSLDPLSLLQDLLGWVFGEAGADMDPDGATTEAGSGMDPNGATTEAGGGMDPNGATLPTGGEAGSGMDPNG